MYYNYNVSVTDEIFPLPEPGNCLDGDQMVNTLTASCAVYAEGSLGGATSFSDKCRQVLFGIIKLQL
jgi:hypothetical protein